MGILFTNSQYLKSISPIDSNVSDKNILPAIKQAQLMEVKPTIGEGLYNKLEELIKEKTLGEDSNIAYKDLLDRLQDFLAYATICRLIPIVSYKIGNMGLSRAHDENLEYSSYNENVQVISHFEHLRDQARLEIQNFILNNRTAYPELNECSCRKIQANLWSANSCGLVLGGPRGRVIHRPKGQNGYDR